MAYRNLEKVLLIFPPIIDHAYLEKQCTPPMGIASLAAYVRDEYDVRLLDCVAEGYHQVRPMGKLIVEYGLDLPQIAETIKSYRPDVVGISCIFSHQYGAVQRISRLVKEIDPEIVTMTGGTHPSFLAELSLNTTPDLDFIVLGEGELTFKELLDHIRNGTDYSGLDGLAFRENGAVRVNPRKRLINDLDTLPYPARELLPIEKYFEYRVPMAHRYHHNRNLSIATSRGCPFKCTFCSSTRHWGKFRPRSVENVLGEMDQLYHQFGVRELKFEDDNLTANRDRARRLFQGMIDRGYNFPWNTPNGMAVWTMDDETVALMKQSGAYEITLAIETGDQWVMDNIIKKPLDLNLVKPAVEKLRRHGIDVRAYAIVGLPGEKVENIRKTFNFMRECGIYRFAPFQFSPLPGSELYQVCLEKGLISEEFDQDTYNLYYRAQISSDITPRELEKWSINEVRLATIRHFIEHPINFIKTYRYSMYSWRRLFTKVMNFIRYST